MTPSQNPMQKKSRASPKNAPPLLVEAKTDANKRLLWTLALLPAIVTFLFYLPVLENGFVDWDDLNFITKNVNIRALNPASLVWMFTSSEWGNWIPLTWLSYALNYKFGGLNPVLFHMTNVFIHVLNTLLVFFSVHPDFEARQNQSCPLRASSSLLISHPFWLASYSRGIRRLGLGTQRPFMCFFLSLRPSYLSPGHAFPGKKPYEMGLVS